MNRIAIEQGRAVPPCGRLVVMGRVLGAFGVKGWISVEPFTESPGRLAEFRAWWIGAEASWRSAPVAEVEVHGSRVVARLEGCTQREAAAALRGAQVAVAREALPEPDSGEYYQTDLLGLAVLNRSGSRLGRIERIFENGAHAVLQLRADDNEGHAGSGANAGERRGEDGKRRGGRSGAERGGGSGAERLIPFVAHVVDRVDLDAGEVRVDWEADW